MTPTRCSSSSVGYVYWIRCLLLDAVWLDAGRDTRKPEEPAELLEPAPVRALSAAAAAGPPYSFCGFSPHTISGTPNCTASRTGMREDRHVFGPGDVADLGQRELVDAPAHDRIRA